MLKIKRSCSIGINRFNRKRFRLTQLKFSNGTLFQPFSVETRSLLGIVITRLPRNLPVVDAQGKHGGCSPCWCCCAGAVVLVLEDVVKYESGDELRQMPFFLFTRRDTRAEQIAQLITHVAAIRARENNSGR